MTSVPAEFVSQQDGDASEFVEIVQSLAMGLVREQQPKRLYVIRIDNWFGPRWLQFAGKVVKSLESPAICSPSHSLGAIVRGSFVRGGQAGVSPTHDPQKCLCHGAEDS
jgi:hypothetical protein